MNVAVVIPFHRGELKTEEQISLARCRDVLASHDRFIALPDGLDTAAFTTVDPGLHSAYFKSLYFTSARGYNLLCRRSEFYLRFADYDFILIYQLDAYVFDDQLAYWCGKEYGYIGAAWPNYEHMTTSKRPVARIPGVRCLLARSGQGGFSLRHVGTMYDACRRLAPLVAITKWMPEDVFWASIGYHLYPKLNLAGFEDSLHFSFDASPAECFRLTGGKLPFGCHGWYADACRGFWEDKIPHEAGT